MIDTEIHMQRTTVLRPSASAKRETGGVKTRNLIIAAVLTGILIIGAAIIQFSTDARFMK